MDPTLVHVDGIDHRADGDRLIHEWRAEQLRRLGLSASAAHALADVVDWHDVARLIDGGCSAALAIEIVR